MGEEKDAMMLAWDVKEGARNQEMQMVPRSWTRKKGLSS